MTFSENICRAAQRYGMQKGIAALAAEVGEPMLGKMMAKTAARENIEMRKACNPSNAAKTGGRRAPRADGEVLALIEKGPITAPKIAAALNLPDGRIGDALGRLARAGKVSRAARGHWYLAGSNPPLTLEDKCLAYLRSFGPAGAVKIAGAVGCNPGSLSVIMARLVDRGDIEVVHVSNRGKKNMGGGGMTVNRWHAAPDPLLRNSGDTIDAHQERVALLCGIIALEVTGEPMSADLLYEARHHDGGERLVGDMPTPAKKRRPELAQLHAKAEDEARIELGCPRRELSDLDAKILNIADRLDAYWWADLVGVDVCDEREWIFARHNLVALCSDIGLLPVHSLMKGNYLHLAWRYRLFEP